MWDRTSFLGRASHRHGGRRDPKTVGDEAQRVVVFRATHQTAPEVPDAFDDWRDLGVEDIADGLQIRILEPPPR